jgi:hypothetical protein
LLVPFYFRIGTPDGPGGLFIGHDKAPLKSAQRAGSRMQTAFRLEGIAYARTRPPGTLDASLTLPQPYRSEITSDSKAGNSNPTNPRTNQGKDKVKGRRTRKSSRCIRAANANRNDTRTVPSPQFR